MDGKPSKKSAPTFDSVREKSALRGHSTPDVAGGFAASINAKHLVLNVRVFPTIVSPISCTLNAFVHVSYYTQHFSTMFSTIAEFKEITRQARYALLGQKTRLEDEADVGCRKVVCSEDGMRLRLMSVKGAGLDGGDMDGVLEIFNPACS